MKVERLFQVLVVQGSLLSGCGPKTPPAAPADAATDDASIDGADTGETSAPVCEDTDSWATCTADGVACCWATAPACEPCCGHLEP